MIIIIIAYCHWICTPLTWNVKLSQLRFMVSEVCRWNCYVKDQTLMYNICVNGMAVSVSGDAFAVLVIVAKMFCSCKLYALRSMQWTNSDLQIYISIRHYTKTDIEVFRVVNQRNYTASPIQSSKFMCRILYSEFWLWCIDVYCESKYFQQPQLLSFSFIFAENDLFPSISTSHIQ